MKHPDEEDAPSHALARALVEQHAQPVGEVCMSLLGSQRDAEEALVEVLERAMPQLGAERDQRAARVWLMGLARQRCAARLAARDRKPELALEGIPEEGALPRRARRLLCELRPTEREALVLRFQGELDLGEVAAACGVDEAAARARISRGLQHLGGLMSKDGA